MKINASISNGKINVTIDKEEKIDKPLKLKKDTIDHLESLRSEWNVTSSMAVDFIVQTFYDLYNGVSVQEKTSQPSQNEIKNKTNTVQTSEKQAKEARKMQVRALMSKGITSRKALSKEIGVHELTIKTYLDEIKNEDNSATGKAKELQEKEKRIQKVIELKKLNKYTNAEIANKINVSKNTLKSYITEINKRFNK